LRHSAQNYGGGVAKKLKKISDKCLILMHCEIALAFFVQCNILLAMRAVELRKLQANL
jgi:hypothetical protein